MRHGHCWLHPNDRCICLRSGVAANITRSQVPALVDVTLMTRLSPLFSITLKSIPSRKATLSGKRKVNDSFIKSDKRQFHVKAATSNE